LRVIVQDGRHLFRTDDFKTHRINVAIANNIIVEVLGAD
jgi:hypothetical protein